MDDTRSDNPETRPSNEAPITLLLIENELTIAPSLALWIKENGLTSTLFPQFILTVKENAHPENLSIEASSANVLLFALGSMIDGRWSETIQSLQSQFPLILVVKRADYPAAVNLVGKYHVLLSETLNPEILFQTIYFIFEQKQLEEKANRAESANQAKSTFLASISHEIRTPMNGVLGMVSLLMDTDLTEEQMDYLQTIHESSNALLTIINDIMDFSKIESGQMELDNQSFDVRIFIESALDLMGPKATENQVDLAYFVSNNVPARVIAPEIRLRQILVNLLGNAVKFTKKGEVSVYLEGRSLGDSQYELQFVVKDTGIGISTENIKQLFKLYSQANASIYTRYGGTGLGLAISKRLVELMGGQIWVESEGVSGKGSTFFFTLIVKEDPYSEVKLERQSFQPVMHMKRVLLMTAKQTQLDYFVELLKLWGIIPCLAQNIEEINELVEDNIIFDAAIVDQSLLTSTESDNVCTLNAYLQSINLPIIGIRYPGLKKELCTDKDSILYLSKPVKPALLYDALRNVFTSFSMDKRKKNITTPFIIQPGELFPLRVLLVEDNVINQKVGLKLLQRLGYQPELAGNGIEAIEALRNKDFDVIFMDMVMPEMNGEEATKNIRAEFPPERQPYIVALTANIMEEDVRRYISTGLDDYISKPVQISQLKQILQKVINKSKTPYFMFEADHTTLVGSGKKVRFAIDREALTFFWTGLGDDTEKIQFELIDMFLKNTPDRLKQMYQLLKINDAEALYHLAHSLKGEGKTFGAVRFSEFCKQLEEMAKERNLSHAPAVFAQLETEYRKVTIELGQILLEISK